jgi:GH24 family phage-related lysozyme (muramidase)
MSNRTRNGIAGLALSAAALVAIWNQEGWTDEAVIPVKGDVPTVGPGLTKRADGSPVQLGDRITPIQGARRSLAHIQRDESKVKQCVAVPLHQAEYDLMVDFGYQYGTAALCRSQIVARANVGDYQGACEAYKDFRLVRAAPGERFGPGMVVGRDGVMRYDCSTLIDGRPNKRCWGVWTRQQKRFNDCMAAQ